MLKVTVELQPWWGSEDGSNDKTLAEMTIYNDGTGNAGSGNYVAIAHDMRNGKIKRASTVQNYPRLNKDVWNLVAEALEGMEYGV